MKYKVVGIANSVDGIEADKVLMAAGMLALHSGDIQVYEEDDLEHPLNFDNVPSTEEGPRGHHCLVGSNGTTGPDS